MRSFTLTLPILLLFPIASCGGPPKTDGVLLVDWTVRGAKATVDACAGIQHLDLQVSPDGAQNQVVISPIDCVHDAAVRYQNLSSGHATLEMIGFDVNGRQLVSGSVRADIEKMVPIVPATLDLR